MARGRAVGAVVRGRGRRARRLLAHRVPASRRARTVLRFRRVLLVGPRGRAPVVGPLFAEPVAGGGAAAGAIAPPLWHHGRLRGCRHRLHSDHRVGGLLVGASAARPGGRGRGGSVGGRCGAARDARSFVVVLPRNHRCLRAGRRDGDAGGTLARADYVAARWRWGRARTAGRPAGLRMGGALRGCGDAGGASWAGVVSSGSPGHRRGSCRRELVGRPLGIHPSDVLAGGPGEPAKAGMGARLSRSGHRSALALPLGVRLGAHAALRHCGHRALLSVAALGPPRLRWPRTRWRWLSRRPRWSPGYRC